jgi:hypothetical protein
VRELPDPRHLGRGVVAAEHEALEERALRQPRTDPDGGGRLRELPRPEGALDDGQQAGDGDVVSPAPEGGQDSQPLGRLIMLRQRAFERKRRALGKRPDVRGADPGGEVVGQPVRLVVIADDDDDRGARPQRCVP